MTFLGLIWLVALVLAAASLAWMCALVGLRLAHEHRQARAARIRKAIDEALIQLLLGACDVQRDLGPYRHHITIMAEALLDFLALVRGHDRELVVTAMVELGVDELLRGQLRRGSESARRACIDALACFPGAATIKALTATLPALKPRLRLAALAALLAAGGDVPLARLLDDLRRKALPNSGLTAEFMRAVVAQAPVEAVTALQEDTLAESVQLLLIDALGAAGDYRAIGCLAGLLIQPAPQVRVEAVTALGRLKHPAAEPCLSIALDDPDARVRAAAAEAIGEAGLLQLCAPLAERLEDPVWRVRFQAAAAMSKLGAPGIDALRSAAGHAGDSARHAAAMALAERGLAA